MPRSSDPRRSADPRNVRRCPTARRSASCNGQSADCSGKASRPQKSSGASVNRMPSRAQAIEMRRRNLSVRIQTGDISIPHIVYEENDDIWFSGHFAHDHTSRDTIPLITHSLNALSIAISFYLAGYCLLRLKGPGALNLPLLAATSPTKIRTDAFASLHAFIRAAHCAL